MALDPRTPVLVGVGAVTQRDVDLELAKEPVDLMVDALVGAAEDAGTRALLEQADTIAVPKGIWMYRDPGRLVADRVGARAARTTLVEVGILQQTPITAAARDIASGRADVALVTGGEAKYRALRALIAGVLAPETVQDGASPDEVVVPEGEIISRVEIARALAIPAHQYAVMETALRAASGSSVDDHAAALARLWASFSEVAATNPDAWATEPVPVEELLHPSPANRMVALPYTKLHCSQWNVDQAAGLILCSVEAATRHRVPRDRWVFPVAATESNAMIPLSRRAEPHRCPAASIGAASLFELAGTTVDDVAHLDLYSCFPAAVQIQAREIGVPGGRPLTMTGGMTFAGGPLNNYVLQAVVTAARVLRADPGSLGLVTSVSGMLTKQGFGLWSTEPPGDGFRDVDVAQPVLDATPTVPVVDDYEGPASVVGYTVVYDAGSPARSVAIVRTPSGAHAVATSSDAAAATAMTEGEWCGRPVLVTGDSTLRLE
jgi:acetyl-CoA C-acetyltransferase